jgi:phage baseplate assembly protein W
MYETDLSEVKIDLSPASERAEIEQNLRMIFGIIKGSVVLLREFGLDPSIIDSPTSIAAARIRAAIVEAAAKWEPRAIIDSITFRGDTETLNPIVRWHHA